MRINVALPFLVRPFPDEPDITPPIVKLPPLMVQVRVLPFNDIVPVPRLRSLLPVKTLLPPSVNALLFARVTAETLVLLRVIPFKATELLVPKAVLLLTLIVPLLSVVVPL